VQRRVITTSAAIVSIAGGAYILLSLSFFSIGFETLPAVIARPGRFLGQSYSLLAYYVPLYLFVLSAMLVRRTFLKKTLFVMTAGVLPLLTFALVIQLTLQNYGTAAEVVAAAFGPKIGATLLLLLGAAEILAIYILTMHIFEGVRLFGGKGPKLLAPPESESAAEETAGEVVGDGAADAAEPEGEPAAEPMGAEDEQWEQFETPDRGISFPDIPAAPKLRVNGEFSEELAAAEGYSPALEAAEAAEEAEEAEAEELEALGEAEPKEPIEIDLDKMRAPDWDQDEQAYAEYESFEEFETLDDPEDDEDDELEVLAEPPNGPGDNGPAGAVQVYEVVEVEPVSHTGPPPPKGTQLQLREKKLAKKSTYKNYTIPEEELLKEYPDRHYWVIDDETREWAEVLKHTLEEFKISAEVTGIQKGPVITMFEILPAPGVKLSKIVNLADNIALRLAASRVRIVAPIPGKHAVGIEVPNKKRALVSFKEMLQSEELKESDKKIPVILGKDITGETQIVDLAQTPHLLIAGATGSGKSVCVNSIICSVLYTRSPDEVRMVLIDPKIVELKLYNDIPHLLTPVITEAKRAFQALQYLLYEMERRYALLDSLGVRDIGAYNRKIKRKRLATQPLPYVVVIVDEFADLMATSGKELESTLARLAAMSRAVGIHLVLATQRPSIDVITGLIKANIPSRIAFMVANKFDSRIIIDSIGADKLLGQGDMLFTSAWNPHPTRIQGAYLSEEEVEHVADYVRTLGEPDYIDEEIFFEEDEEEWDGADTSAANDPLMNKALEVVASAGKASASYLQRRLKIGYNRAARLVEEMEHRGIVGPQNGSKPREILHIPDEHRPE
jgi:DNA segregation ATPase FtsK/SpoIIIE, S-DNA-T family